MESLFFNLTDKKYKTTTLSPGVNRVDISQGIFYIDIFDLKSDFDFRLDYIDKMLMIFVVKDGGIVLDKEKNIDKNSFSMFCYSNYDLNILFKAKSRVFIMFVADFFLKNYINQKESFISKVYKELQKNSLFKQIYSYKIDPLTIFLTKNLTTSNNNPLKAEILSLELILHFLDIGDKGKNCKDFKLANKAKEIILENYTTKITIKELAKLCDTNQTKLKKVFKDAFFMTIYSYIQELRLKKAYQLLKSGDYSVRDVARMVGYLHQGNFSKLFKQKYNIEPFLIAKNPLLAKKC